MPNILTNLVRTQLHRYGPKRVAFTKIALANGEGQESTLIPTDWGTFAAQTEAAANALALKGLLPKQMVAIFAPNCPEILITDFGCYANRAVPVSIYATSSPEQVKYIVNDSKAQMIVVGTASQYATVLSILDECPTLKAIITVDDDIEIKPASVETRRFSEFLKAASEAPREIANEVALRTASASPDDIATLIYTSGTTGEPKGAILAHSCFDATINAHRERLDMISDLDTSVSFLPLSHIFEKGWTYVCLSMGMVVHINRDPRRIQEAVALARPSCMCSVPRFWEKVYAAVQEKMSAAKGIKGWLMRRALKIGTKRNLEYARLGLEAPKWLETRYQFYNRTVFSKLRAAIGIDRGNLFPTAGAPLSARIVEFFHACGINIVIGYGLSETTATVSCYPSVGYEIGSVGTPLDIVQVRLGKDNEILVKGPTVMKGYYGREEDTAKAFTEDGWFRTGDAGLLDASGAIVLTERLKDLFKTSNGKYIAPQAIESRLGEDKYIEQVAVIGDNRKYVTAIIIPAIEALKDYAQRHKIQFDSIEELVQNSEIRKFIADRIEKLQKGLAGFEKIKRFTLLPHEFTIESGELTNTLKIRRPVINSVYADQIEAMYA